MAAHAQQGFGRVALTAGSVVLLAASLVAQSTPPIPGVTGVVEPEGPRSGGTAAVAAVAGKTVEGTRRLLRAIGIGGDKSADPLEALQPGMTVVVREEALSAAADSAQGQDGGQTATEGRVIDINRGTGVIVIRLPDKKTATLQLANRATRDPEVDAGAPPEAGTTVTVSYIDADGQRVMLSFRKVS